MHAKFRETLTTSILIMGAALLASCGNANNGSNADQGSNAAKSPPRVVTTFPENDSIAVDPSLREIHVVFNKAMQDQSWSWSYENPATFPTVTGQPHYTDHMTRNVLPVRLEANKEYVIWINTAHNQNFKDELGTPVAPFKFSFHTK